MKQVLDPEAFLKHDAPSATVTPNCTAGTFLNLTSSRCVACSAGRSSPAGAVDSSECSCAGGSYYDAASDLCVCPEGRIFAAGTTGLSGCLCAVQGVFTNCDLNALLGEHAPHSVYVAEAWNGSALVDLSGNGRHAVLMVAGTVASAAASGDGAANAVTSISGTTATKLLWPESSIPSTFTVCSVTRYTGGSSGRILNCKESPTQPKDWLHGHVYGLRGTAYYQFWTAARTTFGDVDDWLVMCGTNAEATAPGNIVLNQSEIGASGDGVGGCRLSIGYADVSDWALHSVLIWDYSLGTTDMKRVTKALREVLDTDTYGQALV
ncbi:hypothetical protein T484DRAFT_1814734 [Baffinella frigidus]|nr:hypothetical protein T484DRAFT_1814734 [Cryptophyta sp. CCMP2293]